MLTTAIRDNGLYYTVRLRHTQYDRLSLQQLGFLYLIASIRPSAMHGGRYFKVGTAHLKLYVCTYVCTGQEWTTRKTSSSYSWLTQNHRNVEAPSTTCSQSDMSSADGGDQ